MSAPLVVVGDALLDRDVSGVATRLAPDAPVPVVDVAGTHERPGGAALAACLAAERTGREIVLITAIGSGPDADVLRTLLAGRVRLVELPLRGTLPVKTRVLAGGRPVLRLDRGDGVPVPGPDAGVAAVLRAAAGVVVADYGRGVAAALRPELAAVAGSVPMLWDPHPRGPDPVPGVRLATPNAAEAAGRSASSLASAWGAASVVVTMGARGAMLSRGTASPMLIPAPFGASGDPCGAGDCFAATAAVALADGALPEEAVTRAVASATAFVDAGGAGAWPAAPAPVTPIGTLDAALDLATAVRARGGTVVATGGCFDLLHAGHVGLLDAARRAGDCLIVLLNSDESVTRLKGAGRPLNPAADRAAVLAGLASVDAVVVFSEDTPEQVLAQLRPDRWVKGGDYTVDSLPEAAAVRSWGGEAMVLPYLDGRSTTGLLERAVAG
ncbi:D-glycero-beta-D-manno-heptose 1-phosphate adenylyltransferase [Cryptosporangium sp. NPDC051539]|uniref:D-glycero-beta-D-manno-heptose 1-phosphate adenylyltransferase n=1 Tax=Cryptosporangium sp. NPDC051539 TaxID=3363962 RepID=UPI00378B5F2C